MCRVVLVLCMILLFAGCASAPPQNAYSQVDAIQKERAKEHLSELYVKKKRFLERQLLASAERYTDPQTLENNQFNVAKPSNSDCSAMAKGDWGKSVMYGQNFLGYENHIVAVERCFKQ